MIALQVVGQALPGRKESKRLVRNDRWPLITCGPLSVTIGLGHNRESLPQLKMTLRAPLSLQNVSVKRIQKCICQLEKKKIVVPKPALHTYFNLDYSLLNMTGDETKGAVQILKFGWVNPVSSPNIFSTIEINLDLPTW